MSAGFPFCMRLLTLHSPPLLLELYQAHRLGLICRMVGVPE